LLTLYAAAMALLESAVVIYMRRLYYPDNPLDLFPLQFLNSYDPILELSREIATIVMILTVALLAERSSATRSFAAFVFLFGAWDLFYYFWLKVLMGWPRTWLEWDVLFLIPGVWLGPWICPAMIALLFVVWGFWTLRAPNNISFTRRSLTVFVSGALLGLVTFLQPATAVVMERGVAELSQYTPGGYWWWLFVPGYLLMASGFGMTLPITQNRRSG
jgi:hypothetical protein